jgi:hypothetical protein
MLGLNVRSLVMLLVTAHALCGAETNAPVRSLGGGLFRVGQVTIDSSNRTVRFPAFVQLREETIEYVVVHKTGKTHESLFRTEAQPQDVQVAMLLLGAKYLMTNSFGADGKALPIGEKIWVEASWAGNQPFKGPIEDLVQNKETGQSLSHGEWIYNGSNFSEGMFTAQRDGSILSIHIDPDALANNPRPGRENDDLYKPHTGKLPPMGTPVEITIRLGKK